MLNRGNSRGTESHRRLPMIIAVDVPFVLPQKMEKVAEHHMLRQFASRFVGAPLHVSSDPCSGSYLQPASHSRTFNTLRAHRSSSCRNVRGYGRQPRRVQIQVAIRDRAPNGLSIAPDQTLNEVYGTCKRSIRTRAFWLMVSGCWLPLPRGT
jgi:hypothetical protein